MKISFITTIYNEVDSVGHFLESVLKQRLPPDEIIVVDGMSKDGTERVVESMARKEPRIRLIRKSCGIAEGRNIAIRSAKYEIIAVSDAGCILEEEWLEELVKPFADGDVCVSAGSTTPLSTNCFSRVCAELLVTPAEKIDRSKPSPSSRSIAFRRKCWEEVGGYPQTPFYGEDSLFNRRLQKNGCRFVFSPGARVAWALRPDLPSFFRQYYGYSFGDGYLREKRLENLIRLLVHGSSYGALLFLRGAGAAPLSAGIVLLAYYGLLYARRVRRSGRTKARNLPLAMIILFVREQALATGYVAGLLRPGSPDRV